MFSCLFSEEGFDNGASMAAWGDESASDIAPASPSQEHLSDEEVDESHERHFERRGYQQREDAPHMSMEGAKVVAMNTPEVVLKETAPPQHQPAQTLQQEQLILHIQQLRRQQLVEQGRAHDDAQPEELQGHHESPHPHEQHQHDESPQPTPLDHNARGGGAADPSQGIPFSAPAPFIDLMQQLSDYLQEVCPPHDCDTGNASLNTTITHFADRPEVQDRGDIPTVDDWLAHAMLTAHARDGPPDGTLASGEQRPPHKGTLPAHNAKPGP
jgi:hypothetical protein